MPRHSAEPKLLAAARSFPGAIADLRHTVLKVWEVDDGIVIAAMEVYDHRLGGRVLTLPCCTVFHVRDGVVDNYLIDMDVNRVIAP